MNYPGQYPVTVSFETVSDNIPKEEIAFQKVEDERVRAGCNFRKVCDGMALEVNL